MADRVSVWPFLVRNGDRQSRIEECYSPKGKTNQAKKGSSSPGVKQYRLAMEVLAIQRPSSSAVTAKLTHP